MRSPTLGFFGKIPSRGDFVRHGVAAAIVDALDAWCQHVLPVSREMLGELWSHAWMEAPIWRFHLHPGIAGPDALAGLWLPSTDRAGRLFPLFAVVANPAGGATGALLDRAEDLAVGAIEADVTPEALAASFDAACRTAGLAPLAHDAGTWWTGGGPRVAASVRPVAGFPGPEAFARMLAD